MVLLQARVPQDVYWPMAGWAQDLSYVQAQHLKGTGCGKFRAFSLTFSYGAGFSKMKVDGKKVVLHKLHIYEKRKLIFHFDNFFGF